MSLNTHLIKKFAFAIAPLIISTLAVVSVSGGWCYKMYGIVVCGD